MISSFDSVTRWDAVLDHGLCEDCYAGLVDVGDAPLSPCFVGLMSDGCCVCGGSGEFRVVKTNFYREYDHCDWTPPLGNRRIWAER